MKKIFIAIFLVALMLPVAAYALEIDFPGVTDSKGNLIEPKDSFGPANWINYIFVFGLGVVGLAIIGSLVYAGFEWMAGAESSSKIQSAKDRILGSVIGLIILLGSYVFLNTINPQLVSLKNPKIMLNIESGWKNFYKPSEDINAKIVGEPCASGEECISKICGPAGKCMAAAGKIGGKCSTTQTCADLNSRCIKQNGEIISADSDTGTCTTKVPNGAQCSRADQCFIGNCVDELCSSEPAVETGPAMPPTIVTQIGDDCGTKTNTICNENETDGLYCDTSTNKCRTYGREGNLCRATLNCKKDISGKDLICGGPANNRCVKQ